MYKIVNTQSLSSSPPPHFGAAVSQFSPEAILSGAVPSFFFSVRTNLCFLGTKRIVIFPILSESFNLLGFARNTRSMALTNFILTVAGVSAVVLLLRSDVKQSATIFRRNVKHIRKWLEEESANAPKITKELESKASPKEIPKEDKH
ncbi:uncharacterized protein LOC110758942 isoform X2 [Prunus avium]|uniref:Uncharacterized protein LOC110758942 isoform X2 n=1 Tax=Prunus avium TaxID=42229 RepID=A0A6P5SQT7_PRUAV|nr:uncharacterized protein LOC110758942 isoform X2 [Prunus avium]